MTDQPESAANYAKFLQWVQGELKKEQNSSQRRIILSLLWCLVIPIVLSLIWSILMGAKVIPFRYRGVIDFFLVGFPALFLVFIIVQEIASSIPKRRDAVQLKGAFRRNVEAASWREQLSTRLQRELSFSRAQWDAILWHYRVDLASNRTRARYLIGLGGAIFFMLTQGLDLLNADPESLELSWNVVFPRLFPLILFLVVLYLSGSQFVHTLERFEACLDLTIRKQE